MDNTEIVAGLKLMGLSDDQIEELIEANREMVFRQGAEILAYCKAHDLNARDVVAFIKESIGQFLALDAGLRKLFIKVLIESDEHKLAMTKKYTGTAN